MSRQPTRRAPPGWYSDHSRRGYRYWDGESWAEPTARVVAHPKAGGGNRSSVSRQSAGLALLGAAVGLMVAGLALPWTEGNSGNRRVLDGEIPWLVGPGSVADSWLLLLVAAAMLWALLVVVLTGNSRRMWLAVLVAGLAAMGFCVAEGLALDDELDLVGARVGAGLLVAYAGGAAAAIGGVLLRPITSYISNSESHF